MGRSTEKFDLVVALKAQTAEFNKNMNKAKGSIRMFVQGAAPQFGALNTQAGRFLSTFTAGSGAIRSMIPALKGVKAALVSTGIGAILVAIGVALAGVSAWITKTTEGADKFKVALERVKAVGNVLTDRLADMGKALVESFRDWKKGSEDMRRATGGIWQEIKADQAEAAAITRQENQQRKDRIDFIVQEAKLQAEIADLIRDSKDLEFNREQRIRFLNRAIQLQNQLSDERVRLDRVDLDIQQRRMDMGHNSYEELQKAAELERNIFLTEKDRDDKNRELENRIREATNQLNEFEKSQQKALAAQVKINQEYDKAFQVLGDQKDTIRILADDLADLDAEAKKVLETMTDIDQVEYVGLKKVFGDVNTLATLASSAIYGMGMVAQDMFEKSELSARKLADTIVQTTSGILMSYYAEAIGAMLASESKKGLVGLITGAAGVALLTALWNSSMPKLASGGIAYGDTVARVGEYNNARTNPEVIAPLDRLQRILGPTSGQVIFKQHGQELWGTLQEYANANNRMN